MSDWQEANTPPETPNHYLVVQSRPETAKQYRWVRYWNGSDWFDVKPERYGPVTHWTRMPEPPPIKRTRPVRRVEWD